MVVTKYFATHGKKYRRRLIKYLLNPDKTGNLRLVSDFGMSSYMFILILVRSIVDS